MQQEFKVFIKIIITVYTLFLATHVYAINPELDWKTLQTDHFRIHYHTGEKALAIKSAGIAESVHNELIKTLKWIPLDKTELVLSDEVDFSNGFATPLPFNAYYIFITPSNEPNTLEDYDDWLRLIIKHEYTHIIHLDKAAGFPRGVRNVFGRIIWFLPNVLQPNWIIEGLATYLETDVEAGVGRGQSSLFDMMMRIEVANGIKPVSQINLPIRSWPGGTGAYLYGVFFFQFIEQRYGRDALLRYIESNSNRVIPFRVNANTQQTFGKNMTDLWSEFEGYLQERYRPQLQAMQSALVEGEVVTTKGFRTGSPYAMADGSVYYLKNDGFSRPALMRYRDDAEEHVADVHFAARLDMHEQAGALISQPEICNEYNVYYDLYRIPKGSHQAKRLTHCARYVFSSWSPDAQQIIAVKMSLGQSSLHRLTADGELLEILWEGKQDEVVSQIDWSADGSRLVAAVWRKGQWNLELFDLQSKSWSALTDDHWIQMQPRFTEDGESVVFSADYDRVYNIYSLNLSTAEISALTRVMGGAFSPSYANGSLYYSGYGAKGYDIYRIQQAHALGSRALQPPVPARRYEAMDGFNTDPELPVLLEKDYSPWASLRPRWWLPSAAAATGEGAWLGAVTGGNDALRIHAYLLSAAVELNTGTFSATASYIYNNRLSLSLSRGADIYLDEDNENAVESVRLNNEFQLTYAFPFTRVDHAWHLLLNTTLDEEFNDEVGVGVTLPGEYKDALVGAGLLFNNSQHFNFSISASDGRYVKLTAENSDALDSDFSGNIYTLDWNEYIQLAGEHVLALRLVQGWGTESPKPFRLGGVNAISSDVGYFNIRQYNLRGYAENLAELSGRRMQLASSEWRFPLARIERGWMSPPLGLSQIAGSIFYEAGASWDDGSSADTVYRSAGAEVLADVDIFYGLELKMRLGLAHGFDKKLGDDVVYLSIGSSF